MQLLKVLIICISFHQLGFTRTINISGTVKDTSGRGIFGAKVKLEKSEMYTITDKDGGFILRSPVCKNEKNSMAKLVKAKLISFENTRVIFVLAKLSGFSIEIYSINGKEIIHKSKIYDAGRHSFEIPALNSGVYQFKITLEGNKYVCTAVKIGTSMCFSKLNSCDLLQYSNCLKYTGKAKQGSVELLSVRKEEYLDCHIAVNNPETIGVDITMVPNAGYVTDADGNEYQTVRIGKQIWVAENLRTTKYNDGSTITHVPDSGAWCDIYLKNSAVGAYCIYGTRTANHAKYGLFYNWYAVGSGKLAPKGWRVPSESDWGTLQNYLISNGYNYDGSVNDNRAAKSMAAQWDWEESTLEGAIGNDLSKNNASGFSALPGGLRHWGGSYYSKFLERSVTYLWSSTEHDSVRAWHIHLDSHKNYINRITHNKNTGFPVRIVRDAN